MKTAFGMTAVLAIVGTSLLSNTETADARGTPRITATSVQTGPRIVPPPRIKAQQTPSHKSQRGQVNGPRENGRCATSTFPGGSVRIHNRRTSQYEWRYSPGGTHTATNCRFRF